MLCESVLTECNVIVLVIPGKVILSLKINKNRCKSTVNLSRHFLLCLNNHAHRDLDMYIFNCLFLHYNEASSTSRAIYVHI